MTLCASRLGYRSGSLQLLDEVDITLDAGRVHAILGPNGAGKTTLLRILSGEMQPHSGVVSYAGRSLSAWAPRELAQRRAVLPQRDHLTFAFTVEEVVALGRLPAPGGPAGEERHIIETVLDWVGVTHLRARRYPQLSGGERTRVQLARVLAQIWQPLGDEVRTLLLDEPTASLDLAHQHRCLQIARRMAASGVAVGVVLHDPNLALHYADHVTLMCCGQVVASGAPTDVLTASRLSGIYGVPMASLRAGHEVLLRVATEVMDLDSGDDRLPPA
ncbi:MAG: heme ABC transporter ATP-binding protein [Nevskiales bacterium]|nr:heme ABC transporter ATP-binding protein [Nevskiales bacterium]